MTRASSPKDERIGGAGMTTLTILTLEGQTLLFKEPKKFGPATDAQGRACYVVEEDDGIAHIKHTFVWENIVSVTEKKHKAEA